MVFSAFLRREVVNEKKKIFINLAIKLFFIVCLLFAATSGLANPLSVAFKPQVPPGESSKTNNCGQTSALMVMCYYWESNSGYTLFNSKRNGN